jgi:hypothetical protein
MAYKADWDWRSPSKHFLRRLDSINYTVGFNSKDAANKSYGWVTDKEFLRNNGWHEIDQKFVIKLHYLKIFVTEFIVL